MDKRSLLSAFVNTHPENFSSVVDFDPGTDCLFALDLTEANTQLTPEIVDDTARFSAWVSNTLNHSGCRYAVGGYMEHRTIYSRSAHFNSESEPRRLHLGVDIWAAAGTSVYAVADGVVHSFRDNDNFGDYGPTIILEHDLGGLQLYSLYGHLSRADLNGLYKGKLVKSGELIAHFGDQQENGSWPPHLHFQLMFDMQGLEGDYPGVAAYSQKATWLQNIPDPNLLLRYPKAVSR